MKYNPTIHAVERLRDRLGVNEADAKAYVNEMMRKANYVTTQDGGNLVYKCEDSGSMVVVNAETNVIVTVLPPKRQTGIISAAIRGTVEKELRKASDTFKRVYRQYTLQLADVNLEIAELFRNKVRCNHPGTQETIQAQIDALVDESKRIAGEMQAQEREYNAIEDEANTYLSEGVARL